MCRFKTTLAFVTFTLSKRTHIKQIYKLQSRTNQGWCHDTNELGPCSESNTNNSLQLFQHRQSRCLVSPQTTPCAPRTARYSRYSRYSRYTGNSTQQTLLLMIIRRTTHHSSASSEMCVSCEPAQRRALSMQIHQVCKRPSVLEVLFYDNKPSCFDYLEPFK